MTDLRLGAAPTNENEIKYGEPNYRIRSMQDCNKYIELYIKPDKINTLIYENHKRCIKSVNIFKYT